MSDNDKPTRKPLSLNRSGSGTVRQSMGGGRSRNVVVETKKRRVITPGGPKGAAPTVKSADKAKIDKAALAAKKLGITKEEYLKRQAAIQKAQAVQTERDAKKREEAEARAKRDAEERALLEKRRKEEEEAELRRLEAEEAERIRAEAEANRKPVGMPTLPGEKDKNDARSLLEQAGGRIKKSRKAPPSKPSRSNEPRRRRGKLTINSALAGDDERQRSLASVRRARERERERQRGSSGNREKKSREITIPETLTVADLANRMAERAADVIKYLMAQGTIAKINDVLDADMAELIVEDFGHTAKRVSAADVEDNFLREREDKPEDLKPRAPVIAVMGHVDHGKTSLLDALRSTDVASGEAGGITQHIGAYQLKTKDKTSLTVLDTPGHEAFAAMRTRGAESVDIVVLVVAADDGVKPQTIESIKYAQNAGKPIIVAINKMDTYEANAQKIETDLLQYSVITESMSGEVQAVPVSAKEKTGLDDLVEAIKLQAELLELKASPKGLADGLVIESKMEKGRGAVATVLVKNGSLSRGDIVVAGEHWGKVKALTDERNARLKQAGPSVPVEVMGLDGAPAPGEPFSVVESENQAREITEYRQNKARELATAAPSALASMEQMMAKLSDKQTSDFVVVVKADVKGSNEAIKASIEALSNNEIRPRVLSQGVGGISESDIQVAATSQAPILAFNVRANKQAKELAEREGVEIRYYSVIYDLLDDIRGVMEGMLAPEKRETFIGYAELLQVFDISKLGKIAGCRVTEGRVERGAGVRLLRDDVVIHEGELSTLKRFKDEVEKVQAGMECGMGFGNYHDLRKGDQIECFTVEYRDRKLDDVIAEAEMEAEAKAKAAAAAAEEAEEAEDA
jgi:translation initiation factor IF-2